MYNTVICGCPIPGNTIGQKLIQLIGTHISPSPLLPFNCPDLLSEIHPSNHNAVHFQSTKPAAHKLAVLRYENLARHKEREAQKAAKANRSDVTGLKQLTCLPIILPPQTPRL
jgi:hypothetical protein